MKALFLNMIAGIALMVSASVADAATYLLTLNPSFSTSSLVPAGTSTVFSAEYDEALGTITSTTPNLTVSAYTIASSYSTIVGSYMGSAFTLTLTPSLMAFMLNFATPTGPAFVGGGYTVAPAPIPLPAALPLLAVALGAMGIAVRRRKAAAV